VDRSDRAEGAAGEAGPPAGVIAAALARGAVAVAAEIAGGRVDGARAPRQAAGHLAAALEGERIGRVLMPWGERRGPGGPTVLLEPLDGAAGLALGRASGSLFAIAEEGEGLPHGRSLRAAGYILYGPSTLMVLAGGDGVALSRILPGEADPEPLGRLTLRPGDGVAEGPCLVSALHALLLGGGTLARLPPEPGVALLFAAMPAAFVVERAGGSATDGAVRLLDRVPERAGETTPLVLAPPGAGRAAGAAEASPLFGRRGLFTGGGA